MRKIQFDEKTISEIREYIESGHSIKETCNRFTLKEDTLRRVLFEHNIRPVKSPKKDAQQLDKDKVELICKLYRFTDMPIDKICKEVKLENYVVQFVIKHNFSQEFKDKRKARLYSISKLGDKNPMKGVTGLNHPNFKGAVEDGRGYYMIKKPEWYTGRKGSEYVFYHSAVMCYHLGITEIPQGFCVHHIDGNPKNNDIHNLALISISGHTKWHSLQKNLCKEQRLSTKG